VTSLYHVETPAPGTYQWSKPDWRYAGDSSDCAWCADEDSSFEPFDAIHAGEKLCRGHLAEYLGESLDSLVRAEKAALHDMEDLGF